MDALEALRLQHEWGADEALDDLPLDRRIPIPARSGRQVAADESGTLARAPGLATGTAPQGTAPQAGPEARTGPEGLGGASSVEAVRVMFARSGGAGLAGTATAMAFVQGNPDARLAFLGDAASADDDRAGTPFAGAAGELLDRMLASIGLGRDRVLLVNFVPWRPPGGRPPSAFEVAACAPYVERLLAIARPRRLVLLGSLPARALLAPSEPLNRLRGRWMTLPAAGLAGVSALVMDHPTLLLGRPPRKRQAWSDLRLLRRALDADPANTEPTADRTDAAGLTAK